MNALGSLMPLKIIGKPKSKVLEGRHFQGLNTKGNLAMPKVNMSRNGSPKTHFFLQIS